MKAGIFGGGISGSTGGYNSLKENVNTAQNTTTSTVYTTVSTLAAFTPAFAQVVTVAAMIPMSVNSGGTIAARIIDELNAVVAEFVSTSNVSAQTAFCTLLGHVSLAAGTAKTYRLQVMTSAANTLTYFTTGQANYLRAVYAS